MAIATSTQHAPEQGYTKHVYCGVWYKPWTWLRWRKVRVITDFSLISVSLVPGPNKNGDQFPAKLDEITWFREQTAHAFSKSMGVPRQVYDGPLGEKEGAEWDRGHRIT